MSGISSGSILDRDFLLVFNRRNFIRTKEPAEPDMNERTFEIGQLLTSTPSTEIKVSPIRIRPLFIAEPPVTSSRTRNGGVSVILNPTPHCSGSSSSLRNDSRFALADSIGYQAINKVKSMTACEYQKMQRCLHRLHAGQASSVRI